MIQCNESGSPLEYGHSIFSFFLETCNVERCSDGDCYIREREADCTVIWEDYPDVYYAVNVRCNSPGATGTMTATVVVEQQQRPLLGD